MVYTHAVIDIKYVFWRIFEFVSRRKCNQVLSTLLSIIVVADRGSLITTRVGSVRICWFSMG